jgi:sirohydrochlorin cobaltochelatase
MLIDVTDSTSDQRALEELDVRLKTLLPEEYQDYDTVQPTSMGSAGLKYGADGRVAWDEIWGSFCDLAMAGGPPHKGALLEPGSRVACADQPDRYAEVVAEICRGIVMTTELPAKMSATPGWVRVDCLSEVMAAWLVRAIVMENVAVTLDGRALHLPAAPAFRLEKEIKNVITVIAKTCHYWLGHIPRAQKLAIADLFVTLDARVSLVAPGVIWDDARETYETLAQGIAAKIHAATGLVATDRRYQGWLGVECADIRAAIWMMRGLVASNVLARREGTVLFVPINPARSVNGDVVTRTLADVHRLAAAAGVL